MTSRWGLLLLGGLLLAASPVAAQPISGHALSVESIVLSADQVFVGKVTSSEAGKGETTLVTFAVDEVHKGAHRKQIRVRFEASPPQLSLWTEKERRLLVATSGEPAIIGHAMDLDDEQLAEFSADLALLRTPRDVLKVVLATCGKHPGVTRIKTFSIPAPRAALIDTKWAQYHSMSVEVPVDEQLEKWAQEQLRTSEDYIARVSAATALRYFRSWDNLGRISVLLEDDTWAYLQHPAENRGREVRHYGVREAAYQTLIYWDVKAEPPKLRAEFFRPEAVKLVVLSRKEIAAEELPSLDRFPNLQTLILRNTPATDDHLKQLARLKSLTSLELSGTKITDAGLAELAVLTNLAGLDIGSTGVTDDGLKELVALESLHRLYLNGTQVTDAGMKHLAGFTQLQMLDLSGTRVTDAGLKEIANFTKLKELYTAGANVTDEGVDALRARRTDMKIHP